MFSISVSRHLRSLVSSVVLLLMMHNSHALSVQTCPMKHDSAHRQEAEDGGGCCGAQKDRVTDAHHSGQETPCQGNCCRQCKILLAPIWGLHAGNHPLPAIGCAIMTVVFETIVFSQPTQLLLPENHHDPTLAPPLPLPLRI